MSFTSTHSLTKIREFTEIRIGYITRGKLTAIHRRKPSLKTTIREDMGKLLRTFPSVCAPKERTPQIPMMK